jgi:hypothetical protein
MEEAGKGVASYCAGVGVHLKPLNRADDSSKLQILGGVMPEPEPEMKSTQKTGELNISQQRRLRVTCEYIDKLLGDTERVLHSTASESPFPRYVSDLTVAQSNVIDDHIRRLRSQLLRALAWQHMEPHPPDIPATRMVGTYLAFIDIAIEELRPRYMVGYGTVPQDVIAELNRIVSELHSLVESAERCLDEDYGATLRHG